MVYYIVETLVWFGVRFLVVVGLVFGLPLGLHDVLANVDLWVWASCFKRSVLVPLQRNEMRQFLG